MNIAPIRKAIVAFVLGLIVTWLGLIVTWLGRVGFSVDAELRDSIESVLSAVAVAVSVYLVPNAATPDEG